MMDQQFIDREKELFKLNAKLNAKSKKIAPSTTNVLPSVQTIRPQKTVQIHTANNNFNYYDEALLKDGQAIAEEQQQQQQQFELMCKKINITNLPSKKPQEIVYPFFHRQTTKQQCRRVDIHMPTGSLMSDGKADDYTDIKSIKTETAADGTETSTLKNESLITRHSDDTSAVPPCTQPPTVVETLLNKQLPPAPIATDIVPKYIEKKISNDGLLK